MFEKAMHFFIYIRFFYAMNIVSTWLKKKKLEYCFYSFLFSLFLVDKMFTYLRIELILDDMDSVCLAVKITNQSLAEEKQAGHNIHLQFV